MLFKAGAVFPVYGGKNTVRGVFAVDKFISPMRL
jgi:hypothetical protein